MKQPVTRDQKVAFLFPGQGSQYVGMGKNLYDHFKLAKEIFEQADEALQFKISKLCFEGPWEELTRTVNTQPAMLTVSIAALKVLQSETRLAPTLLAGHSLGEYSALVAGGVIEFSDAVRVVRARGQFIQEAVPAGKGALGVVLGLAEAIVKSICEEAAQGEIVTPANYNCPGQIAISGHRGAVRRAISLARKQGAKGAALLPVSAPIHSPLMELAAKKLKDVLASTTVSDAFVPVISNVDAQPQTSGTRIKELLVQHVSSPVRWEDSIKTMLSHPIRRFIEVGPGKVLSGLFKWINPDVALANVENVETLKAAKAI